MGTGRCEVDLDTGSLFDDAGADLELTSADGSKLSPGEIHPAPHGIAERQHQPVGGSVQDEAELVDRPEDRLYRRTGFGARDRVEQLFMLYDKMRTPLDASMLSGRRKRRRK